MYTQLWPQATLNELYGPSVRCIWPALAYSMIYVVIVRMYSNGGIEMSLDFGTTCQDVVVTGFTLPSVSFSFVEVRKGKKICEVGCCPWRMRKSHVMGRNANV